MIGGARVGTQVRCIQGKCNYLFTQQHINHSYRHSGVALLRACLPRGAFPETAFLSVQAHFGGMATGHPGVTGGVGAHMIWEIELRVSHIHLCSCSPESGQF